MAAVPGAVGVVAGTLAAAVATDGEPFPSDRSAASCAWSWFSCVWIASIRASRAASLSAVDCARSDEAPNRANKDAHPKSAIRARPMPFNPVNPHVDPPNVPAHSSATRDEEGMTNFLLPPKPYLYSRDHAACPCPLCLYLDAMSRILVIEDDPITAEEITAELGNHGHDCVWIADGAEALERATRERFDAITLDRMLPGIDGLTLVSRLRERKIGVPVLMISALSDVDETDCGPASWRRRLSREALRPRRDGDAGRRSVAAGERALPKMRRSQSVRSRSTFAVASSASMDEAVRLLHIEYRLLEFLARNVGQAMSRSIIFEQVWGYHFDPGANLINVHIARLRKKLDRPGRVSVISTVKGEGYRLDAV